jgi:hypothetical protein
MKAREMLLFTRELSDLLQSGMTLGNALNTLATAAPCKGQDAIVLDLRDEIIRGTSLSDALARWPRVLLEPLRQHGAGGRGQRPAARRAGAGCASTTSACWRRARRWPWRAHLPGFVLSVGVLTMLFVMIFVVIPASPGHLRGTGQHAAAAHPHPDRLQLLPAALGLAAGHLHLLGVWACAATCARTRGAALARLQLRCRW